MQSFYKFKGKPVLRTAIQMLYGWRKLLLMLLCLCFSAQALAVTLQDVRYNRLPDKTQLVLDLDRPTVFRQFSLAGPPRIVLDLPDAARSGRAGLTLNTGAVSSIRTGFSNETTLRVVIDLLYPAKANIYTMPPENGRGNRIVIDIYDNLAEQALTLESLEEAQPPYVVFATAAKSPARRQHRLSQRQPTAHQHRAAALYANRAVAANGAASTAEHRRCHPAAATGSERQTHPGADDRYR